MNNRSLDQKLPIGHNKVSDTPANVQKKSHSIISKGCIMEELMKLAFSIPDFRRLGKGNHRHKLGDTIILMILARMSKCIARAEIIEFGKHNLAKFRSMGLLRNGVPSEPTLCRIEQGIDENGLASCMTAFTESFVEEVSKKAGVSDVICVDGKAMRGTLQSNGRNPDIVSAYSQRTGITLATEICDEKSNEITAVPRLLKRLNLKGKVVTADAMSMQKGIIDTIRSGDGDFVIEIKANQRALRYGIEDKIKLCRPIETFTEGPILEHGRIETRTYRTYDGLDLIADKEKWGGNLTVVEFEAHTINKSTGVETNETRLYASSLDTSAQKAGKIIRCHWAIESMHWALDFNLQQDKIKRKHLTSARNLDTIQRIVHTLFSMWRCRRKKFSDKAKGIAELMRPLAMSFTKLIHFLGQK